MRFLLVVAGIALFAALLGRAIDYEHARAQPPPVVLEQPGTRYQGKTARWWAKRAVQARKDANARGRTIRRLKRELAARHAPSSVRAIALASVAYRVSFNTLYRKASCETGGTLSPFAYNRSSHASGLFQFLPSTWRSTPYGRYSIWDPYANALAAAWMHSPAVGRGGEWVCR